MTNSLLVRNFGSSKTGPRILLLGAVHGDEICGMYALSRLICEIEAGLLNLVSGSLAIVPVCNPAAYLLQKRYVGENLNRIIGHYSQPRNEEYIFADQIAALIDEADFILDLHAYHSGHVPYLFLDHPTVTNQAVGRALGLPFWVTGWDKLYNELQKEGWSSDTVGYAHTKGKDALLIECGHYQDSASISVAYQCVRASLAQLGLIYDDKAVVEQNSQSSPVIIQMQNIIWRNQPGSFAKDWVNLQPCQAGELIAEYDDGTKIFAPNDGVIVLPNPNAQIGHEWFYLGEYSNDF